MARPMFLKEIHLASKLVKYFVSQPCKEIEAVHRSFLVRISAPLPTGHTLALPDRSSIIRQHAAARRQKSDHPLPHAQRRDARGRRRFLHRRKRRNCRHRRRIWFGKIGDVLFPVGADSPAARAHSFRPGVVRWRGSFKDPRKRAAQNPRKTHHDDFPRSDDLAEPVYESQRSVDRTARAARKSPRKKSPAPGDRRPGRSGNPRPGKTH